MGETHFFEVGPSGPRVIALEEPNQPGGAPVETKKRAEAEAVRASVTRRRDAVVDAARTLEDLSVEGVRAFVTRRWAGTRVLEESDVESFSVDARAQRIDDVVDALESRARSGVFGRSSKHVSVSFPRGWVLQTLRAMDTTETASVRQRLVDRGWSEKELDKHLKPFKHTIGKSEGATD